jgi:hypothetical protein
MGYTHYWNQSRSFTVDEWTEVSTDLASILAYAGTHAGIVLANGMGDGGTVPEFTLATIMFNGMGDDAHETFVIHHKRTKEWEGGTFGGSICKTARKPYDAVVTACLCYLSSVSQTHLVASDGKGVDFLAGLALARAALPGKANMLDIPIDVMRDDRWTGPWVSGDQDCRYHARFCVDGFGYVELADGKKGHRSEWYRFESHRALAEFLDANKYASFPRGGHNGWGSYPSHEPNIWRASGSFDATRNARIARAQAKVLGRLFPADAAHAFAPPAYVRPNEIPSREDMPFCYSLEELLAKVAA